MRLKTLGLQFREKFKIVGGQHFLGQLLDIPDTSRVSNFLSTRRYLRTGTNSPLVPTNVVEIGDELFIVANHGTGRFKGPLYKIFKLFKVDLTIDWTRRSESKNQVTALIEKGSDQPLGDIYVSVQPESDTNDSTIRIQQPNRLLLTNAAVQIDDIINNGDWIVTKVDSVLGIYMVEVKDK